MIAHPIYRVLAYQVLGPYTLRVQFDDQSWQTIDFELILRGAMYGQLRNLELFNQVRIDPEVQTLVWPNGADFDPATLHDWPDHLKELRELASDWEQRATKQAHEDVHPIRTT
jgi:Protein of unknown function (DUF2442)